MVALAVVGMDFREGPTGVRAGLVALDSGPESPSAELLSSGAANGVARLETCSRTEWVLSSRQPQWAAELLRSALMTRLSSEGGRRMHLKVGPAAAHYLMRVAAGLESLAEGEPAVGRQVLRGFERAHAGRRTDKALNACWRAVGALIHKRRSLAPSAAAVGVHALAISTLESLLPGGATVLVFGQGQIGKAVMRSLTAKRHFQSKAFNRATLEQFRAATVQADGVIVCSGADQAWLALPARRDGPVAIDLGSPDQLTDAPGWQRIALDDLLSKGGLQLPDAEREALEQLCTDTGDSLLKELRLPSRAKALEAIDSERRDFLEQTLPKLLEGLPAKEQKRLRASIASFTHSVMKRTRTEL